MEHPLSIEMRAQKAIDHLTHGKCGPTELDHKKLEEWIARAERLEDALTLACSKINEVGDGYEYTPDWFLREVGCASQD